MINLLRWVPLSVHLDTYLRKLVHVWSKITTLSNGDSYKLKIKKRNEELDLALYQMISDRDDFSFIKWNESNLQMQSLVLSAYTELDEIRVGIKSAKPRKSEGRWSNGGNTGK